MFGLMEVHARENRAYEAAAELERLRAERDALLAQLTEARDAIVAGQQREYAIVNAMVRQTFTGKWHELAGGVITPRREEAVGLFYRRAGIDPPPCPCPPGEGDCRAVTPDRDGLPPACYVLCPSEAAAPDLLAACEAMLSTWGSDDEAAIVAARDAARAAVAKAKGGA